MDDGKCHSTQLRPYDPIRLYPATIAFVPFFPRTHRLSQGIDRDHINLFLIACGRQLIIGLDQGLFGLTLRLFRSIQCFDGHIITGFGIRVGCFSCRQGILGLLQFILCQSDILLFSRQ